MERPVALGCLPIFSHPSETTAFMFTSSCASRSPAQEASVHPSSVTVTVFVLSQYYLYHYLPNFFSKLISNGFIFFFLHIRSSNNTHEITILMYFFLLIHSKLNHSYFKKCRLLTPKITSQATVLHIQQVGK